MDCSGTLFRFLAYSFSGFLGLSANSLGSLFGFFSDCFSDFLGFSACGFKSVFNYLSCFFRSVLYVSSVPSCPTAASALAATNVIVRLAIFITASFSFPVQRKRMRRPCRVQEGTVPRRRDCIIPPTLAAALCNICAHRVTKVSRVGHRKCKAWQ